MVKDYLNKGISTPLAIIIILTLAIVVGMFVWHQYLEFQDTEFRSIYTGIFKGRSTCVVGAATKYRSYKEGEDPCDRSCQSDDDCKFECGCDCISKDEKCGGPPPECEMIPPDWGCRCINNKCDLAKLEG